MPAQPRPCPHTCLKTLVVPVQLETPGLTSARASRDSSTILVRCGVPAAFLFEGDPDTLDDKRVNSRPDAVATTVAPVQQSSMCGEAEGAVCGEGGQRAGVFAWIEGDCRVNGTMTAAAEGELALDRPIEFRASARKI